MPQNSCLVPKAAEIFHNVVSVTVLWTAMNVTFFSLLKIPCAITLALTWVPYSSHCIFFVIWGQGPVRSSFYMLLSL